jgi:hypothetical protein
VTWAHAGSLSHVRQQLIETFAFIAGEEPEAIEERLAALAADSQSKKHDFPLPWPPNAAYGHVKNI